MQVYQPPCLTYLHVILNVFLICFGIIPWLLESYIVMNLKKIKYIYKSSKFRNKQFEVATDRTQ